MNLPNILTVFRILLVPVFVIFVINNDFRPALLVFITAGITDGLDGLLARVLDKRTTIGAYLDPIADKMLLISAYLSLTIKGMLPGWLSVVVVSRDVIILSGIAVIFLMGKALDIKPSMISKLTTVFQILTIIAILYPFSSGYLQLFVMATAVLTVVSGLQYIYGGIKAMGEIK